MRTTPSPNHRYPKSAAAIALSAALLIAAGCSTTDESEPVSGPEPATETEADDLAVFLTACMREQGIDDFPEARVLPDGSLDLDMSALDAAGLGPGTPDFNTAFAACESEAGQPIELGDHTNQFDG